MKQHSMRIVVVGGSGFIGRHFVRAAAGAGHEVCVVSRGGAGMHSDLPGVRVIGGGAEALAANPQELAAADAILHFASTSIPASSNADPVADIRGNLIPGVMLLDAMREAGCKRIIYLSSGGAIYGRPLHSPIPEDHPQRPISSYGVVKGALERYLGMYADLHGFRAAIVRPANPFGPGQDLSGQIGVISAMLGAARSGERPVVYGDGSIVRDFLYIDDLCTLLLGILERDATGTYNCGSGTGASIAEVMAIVEKVSGCRFDPHYLPARAFDPPAIVLDIARARAELDWTPQVSLEEGIARTWHWLQEQTS